VFAEAEKLGLEGIVSKHRDSHYRSGRTDRWRKVKCWTKSELVVIGTAVDKRTAAPIALFAEDAADGLRVVKATATVPESLVLACPVDQPLAWPASALPDRPKLSKLTDRMLGPLINVEVYERY